MPEIMEPNLPKPRLCQYRKKMMMCQIVGIENGASLGRKYKIVRNRITALALRREQALVSQLKQNPAKLPGEIDAPGLLAFWSCESAANIVALDEDETVCVGFVLAELNVGPPERDKFATT